MWERKSSQGAPVEQPAAPAPSPGVSSSSQAHQHSQRAAAALACESNTQQAALSSLCLHRRHVRQAQQRQNQRAHSTARLLPPAAPPVSCGPRRRRAAADRWASAPPSVRAPPIGPARAAGCPLASAVDPEAPLPCDRLCIGNRTVTHQAATGSNGAQKTNSRAVPV